MLGLGLGGGQGVLLAGQLLFQLGGLGFLVSLLFRQGVPLGVQLGQALLVLGDLCGHRIRSLLLLGQLLLQLLRLLGAALELGGQDGQVGFLVLKVAGQRRRLLPQGVQSQFPLAHLLPQRLRLGVELLLCLRR